QEAYRRTVNILGIRIAVVQLQQFDIASVQRGKETSAHIAVVACSSLIAHGARTTNHYLEVRGLIPASMEIKFTIAGQWAIPLAVEEILDLTLCIDTCQRVRPQCQPCRATPRLINDRQNARDVLAHVLMFDTVGFAVLAVIPGGKEALCATLINIH